MTSIVEMFTGGPCREELGTGSTIVHVHTHVLLTRVLSVAGLDGSTFSLDLKSWKRVKQGPYIQYILGQGCLGQNMQTMGLYVSVRLI